MVYRVTDKHDNVIASGALIEVAYGGVLKVVDDAGGVDLFIAPGHWANAFWESSNV